MAVRHDPMMDERRKLDSVVIDRVISTVPTKERGYKSKKITDTTLIRTGKTVLHRVVVNDISIIGNVVIYDGTTSAGTMISPLHFHALTDLHPRDVEFNAKLDTGLYVKYSASVSVVLTFMYREGH